MTEKTIPIKGEEYIFYVGLTSRSIPQTLINAPVMIAGDVQISIDGGALVNITNLPTTSGKIVEVYLTASEMNGDSIVVLFTDGNNQWCDLLVELRPSASTIGDLTTSADVGNDIIDTTLVGSYTFGDVLKVMAAVLAGRTSGGGTTTMTFRSIDNTSNVLISTIDAHGNRSNVTITV